jgi:hypothetical protein
MKATIRARFHAVVRSFIWLICCVAAVGVHHTWFDICERGSLMAFADGAVLVVLSLGMHELRRIIMRPNAKSEAS